VRSISMAVASVGNCCSGATEVVGSFGYTSSDGGSTRYVVVAES
jgi:hypothetical protein